VLWLNGWRCPLTDVAARYTDDRRANFDIYLPEWLARYNELGRGRPWIGLARSLLAPQRRARSCGSCVDRSAAADPAHALHRRGVASGRRRVRGPEMLPRVGREQALR
jgi:hypothetical protein